MSGCTAPRQGHRTSGGVASCPVCSSRSRGYRSSYTPAPVRTYPAVFPSAGGRSGGSGGGGGGTRKLRGGTVVHYTVTEWRTVEPIAREADLQAQAHPDKRDLFLCHAWDDRQEGAKELYDCLVGHGASVWFSEYDLGWGKSLLLEIDKGLRNSRAGIVLVTPAMLKKLATESSTVNKELSALLASDRVAAVAYGATMEELREVNWLLASRSGWTVDETLSLDDIAKQLAAATAAERD